MRRVKAVGSLNPNRSACVARSRTLAQCCELKPLFVNGLAVLLGQSKARVRQRLREWTYAVGDMVGSRRGVISGPKALRTAF